MNTQRPLKPATDHTLSFAENQFAVFENSDEVWTLTQGKALVVLTTQDNKTPSCVAGHRGRPVVLPVPASAARLLYSTVHAR